MSQQCNNIFSSTKHTRITDKTHRYNIFQLQCSKKDLRKTHQVEFCICANSNTFVQVAGKFTTQSFYTILQRFLVIKYIFLNNISVGKMRGIQIRSLDAFFIYQFPYFTCNFSLFTSFLILLVSCNFSTTVLLPLRIFN